MSYMFIGCSSLTTTPLIDTNKVTKMCYMFANCKSLTSIPFIILILIMKKLILNDLKSTTLGIMILIKLEQMIYIPN